MLCMSVKGACMGAMEKAFLSFVSDRPSWVNWEKEDAELGVGSACSLRAGGQRGPLLTLPFLLCLLGQRDRRGQ